MYVYKYVHINIYIFAELYLYFNKKLLMFNYHIVSSTHVVPSKIFMKWNKYSFECNDALFYCDTNIPVLTTCSGLIVVQWQQDENGKETREDTVGKFGRVKDEKEIRQGNREDKTGTVLEFSLEVMWHLWDWLSQKMYLIYYWYDFEMI